jgi:hypothetical protein
MAESAEGEAIRRWSRASAWFSAAVLGDLRKPGRPDPEEASSVWAAIGAEAMGTWFPGEWRGKSTFAPLKARLYRRVLGPLWYEKLYERDPWALWVVPDRFAVWKRNPLARSTVGDVLELFLAPTDAGAALRARLSGLGWGRLLQAALDFCPDRWQRVYERVPVTALSDAEAALLFQIY